MDISGRIHKELLIVVNLGNNASTRHFTPFCVSLYWFYNNKEMQKQNKKQIVWELGI